MNLRYIKEAEIDAIEGYDNESFGAIIIPGSYLINRLGEAAFEKVIDQSAKLLKKDGMLFIQGSPYKLPDNINGLMSTLNFKYWIAIDSNPQKKAEGLPNTHSAVVMFVKGNNYKTSKVRFPHKHCIYCNKTLKDWGGKAHLMNPEGHAISDVWRSLPKQDNHNYIHYTALEVLLKLINIGPEMEALVYPYEGIMFNDGSGVANVVEAKTVVESSKASEVERAINEKMINKIHHGDAVKLLKSYPENSIDLVFADPPYNLDKAYTSYSDEKGEEDYLSWCNSWLIECVRVLKPTGSLFLLNLPKWAVHHAAFLNRYLHLNNWIVWDALSEPRGKIMPAHYALLYYTAHPTKYTLNYDLANNVDNHNFCLRPTCVKKRKKHNIDPKSPLTDIWSDIHRIKHRAERDLHPCQLPEKLLERIILLSSNEGDVVLDPLCGAGATPVAAAKHKRNFVAIDIDRGYVDIAREKIKQVRKNGYVPKKRTIKQINEVTKKELQLELRKLAVKLERLPTKEDVVNMSEYDMALFDEMFVNWGKALKAAKLERLENVGEQR